MKRIILLPRAAVMIYLFAAECQEQALSTIREITYHVCSCLRQASSAVSSVESRHRHHVRTSQGCFLIAASGIIRKYQAIQSGPKLSRMTQVDPEQGNDDSGFEEGLAGGPGAPMPLTQLAVCSLQCPQIHSLLILCPGPGWFNVKRHPTCCRWRLSYSRGRCLYVSIPLYLAPLRLADLGAKTEASTRADQGHI